MIIFRQMLFSKIVPNINKLGLLTPQVRERFEQLQVIQYADRARLGHRGARAPLARRRYPRRARPSTYSRRPRHGRTERESR